MNKITLINIEFLRPKRCVETYELSIMDEKEICYIYNYEDKFYRYFRTLRSLMNYLKDRIEPKIKFKEKNEMMEFLRYKNIITINQTEDGLVEVEV
ncbi:hypothetical protein EO244_08510 [Ancylomarina salipaludis]|uniref:Uncharacterized protein n=1 Tax=Ancylomarina salipaludis TaxID=2501299 RepID=A0A4Q1JLU4_9BACT|nr:hypothetical protein [Ancylomarina salipaludis]RXQ95082.1 hypothetical protein EO244_08510 [Ancylomarina salipaludis]